MNRRLFASTLVFIVFLVAIVLVFAQAASAGLPSVGGSGSSQAAKPGAGTPSPVGRDDITYPLQEGFESGDLGSSLLHSQVALCVPGSCGWYVSGGGGYSGNYFAYAPEWNNLSDQRLVLNNPVSIPLDATSANLSFYHHYDFEAPNYDGGVLEFSTDGGTVWTDVLSTTSFLAGGYNGVVYGDFENPLANRSAWIGALGAYNQVSVDLMPFAGQSVTFRIRMGTDNCCTGGASGWYVDEVSISLAAPTSCPPVGWGLRAPYPIAIADQAVVAHQGLIYSFGGFSGINSTSPVTDSYKYDSSTNTWTVISSLPEARGGNRAVSNGIYIYILGGKDGPGNPRNNLWRYDPMSDTYTALAADPFDYTFDHEAVYKSGAIHRIAGCTNSSCSSRTSSISSYSISSNTWSACPSGYPLAVGKLSAVTYQSRVYVAGGNPDTNAVYTSSGCTSWSVATPMPGERYGAASDILNGRWFMAGGWLSGAVSNSILASSPSFGSIPTWTRPPSMPLARYLAGGVTANYGFYVIGGYDSAGNPTTSNQRYYELPCTTFTPGPSNTPTDTATFTETPTITDTPTETETPSATNSPADTQTPTETPIETVTGTPTETSTATATATATPTYAAALVGHVIWGDRPPQPDPLQQLPVTLTLKMGSTQVDYPAQYTDASGFFTVTVEGLATGAYDWRVRGPAYLSNSGNVSLTGAAVTNVEIGTMKAGDINGDNIVDIVDFSLLKANFGLAGSPPLQTQEP